MIRLFISFFLAILMCTAICDVPARAVGEWSTRTYSDWSPKVEWHLKSVGKLSSEIQIGPNGLLYAHSGSKLTVFDENGHKLWDVTNKNGSATSAPVFDSQGSIFVPGKNMFQEFKLNGSTGWSFSVFLSNSGSQTLLTAGPGRQLYLHTPSGLYAVDTVGRYRWMLYQWNMARNTSTTTETFKVIAAAGDSRVVLSVVARDKGGAQLLAFDQEGKLQWRFAMGEVKNVDLVFGPDGYLYVTQNPSGGGNSYGALHAFDVYGNGKPLWTYRIRSNKLTAPTPTNHDQLYFMDGDLLYALNQVTGKEIWSNDLPKANARPAADENSMRVYVGGRDNQLIAMNPNGRVDWWMDLGGKITMKPLMAPDGYIYVATDKGDIYKIKDRPN